MPTHYQTLGVDPGAPQDEIRRRYRALANELHPDRHGEASEAEQARSQRRMAEVNAAYLVLSDPEARRRYDAERSSSAPVPRTAPPRPAPTSPAQVPLGGHGAADGTTAAIVRALPWIAVLVVLALIFLVTGFAKGGGDGDPAPPSTTGPDGSCFAIRPGPVTSVVACDAPGAYTSVARVVDVGDCPSPSEARRLSTDGLFDCVIRTS